MSAIRSLTAQEILDSRGRPTIEVGCTLESGATASVSVPSGASTGSAEALELRDGDPRRYRGLGCRAAVRNVVGPIAAAIAGVEFDAQRELDATLTALDGTSNKSNLGANAMLGVSLAFARAVAVERDLPLYRHFAGLLEPGMELRALPRPTINLFSGGKHAGGQVEIQDILLVANGASTVDEALAWTWAVYQTAADLIQERYGERALSADEGGLAPSVQSIEALFELAVDAITDSGFRPGTDLSLCLDVAASHFVSGEGYRIGSDLLFPADLVERIGGWVEQYPIVSVEDGLAEDDWANWPSLFARISNRAIVLGDDLLTTNPARIQRAIETGSANALLLKVNQIGTLSEAAEAARLARSAGWAIVVSARSGETEDNWLSDLAVGWQGEALKVGSITRSERLAKWNRLLAIERETGLPVTPWPNSTRS
ncbi:MAG: phosphopyruvate hydratase [Thermomicrobiales bacterium]|nr:phosphopyruvate hydratase [Thermomicrobiales bacterium]